MSGGNRIKARLGSLLEGTIGSVRVGHTGGGALRGPAEQLGEGGRCFGLQPGLTPALGPTSLVPKPQEEPESGLLGLCSQVPPSLNLEPGDQYLPPSLPCPNARE